MPTYILMNEAQANQVRGQTQLGHAFAPVAVPNTNPQLFAAPVECQDDPVHASIRSLLLSFTHATTAPVGQHPNETLTAACTFNDATWTPGQKIVVDIP